MPAGGADSTIPTSPTSYDTDPRLSSDLPLRHELRMPTRESTAETPGTQSTDVSQTWSMRRTHPEVSSPRYLAADQ